MLSAMNNDSPKQPAPPCSATRKWLRRIILLISIPVLAFVLFLSGAELYVRHASQDKLYDHAADVPGQVGVGLVLGCSPYLRNHRENPYFRHRVDAAASLWHAGKVRALIVSGDNTSHEYNEPLAMKEALVELGVPTARIVCDYAGLRTLDSVVRAREIFGADRLVIVSQPYHNERALAIARHYGIDAVALNAEDVALQRMSRKSWVRERGARMKMLLDLWLLGTGPRYLGAPVPLPE